MELLHSEQFALAMENLEPSNYTMRPNIIDHLTYDEIDEKTGEVTIKRLSVYACHLYMVMRTLAGQQGITWKNTENLAELANMSKGQVCNCKKELMNKFHQLDGNPLILILERSKTTMSNGEKTNGTIYHQITIKCIWNFNRVFFLLKKFEKEARSPDEHAGGARSPDEHALEEARSPGERNKIHNNKTSLSKEQHSTAEAVSVCSSKKEDASVSSTEQTRMANWLLQIGCDPIGAVAIIQNFSPEDLMNASGYVQKQMSKMKKKNEEMTNIAGYLRKTLENKWWKKQTC